MTIPFTAEQIDAEATRLARRGLAAAAAFLAGEIRRVLSEPAPRLGGRGLAARYAKATPGAPPRKRTGRLRASVAWDQPDQDSARVGVGVRYGRFLEQAQSLARRHPFLKPTLERLFPALVRIVGEPLNAS